MREAFVDDESVAVVAPVAVVEGWPESTARSVTAKKARIRAWWSSMLLVLLEMEEKSLSSDALPDSSSKSADDGTKASDVASRSVCLGDAGSSDVPKASRGCSWVPLLLEDDEACSSGLWPVRIARSARMSSALKVADCLKGSAAERPGSTVIAIWWSLG